MDCKVDAIANAIQSVKAWIISKVIDEVIQNKNREITSSNIDKAVN